MVCSEHQEERALDGEVYDVATPDAYIPCPAMSRGLVSDSSIHDFDARRWVTGQEVDAVYATGSVRAFDAFARHGDIDTGAGILRLGDRTLGVLRA